MLLPQLPFRVTWEELKDSFRKFGMASLACVSRAQHAQRVQRV